MAADVKPIAARDRILAAAYELFARRGVRDVGVDEIVARSGVAKATLYKHFRSKEDLVLAFLELHEQRWTRVLEAEAMRRAATGEGRLLALFDVLDEWYRAGKNDGCSFVNVMAEMGPLHPLGQASVEHLDELRNLARRFAVEADLRDPDGFARDWQVLVLGSLLSAASGDCTAARRAQSMAGALILDRSRSGWSLNLMALGPDGLNEAAHDHVVNLYDEDEHMVFDASRFLAEGLCAAEAVVVLSTPAHRDAFEARLRDLGVDLPAARDDGRYRWLDAADTLATFMDGDDPNEDRFVATIGRVIAAAATSGRPVRAFGEMVALLWDDDNVSGAIELESLWNDLARQQRFALYCAYPMAAVAGNGELTRVQQVCAHHSGLVAPKSYGSDAPSTERLKRAEELSEIFVPVPAAVRAARQFVHAALSSSTHPSLTSDASLVVSELAANAVLHAKSAFRASLAWSGPILRIAVDDLSSAPPRLQSPSPTSPSGRGLRLIDRLAARWGTERGSHGKSVWVELDGSSHA